MRKSSFDDRKNIEAATSPPQPLLTKENVQHIILLMEKPSVLCTNHKIVKNISALWQMVRGSRGWLRHWQMSPVPTGTRPQRMAHALADEPRGSRGWLRRWQMSRVRG